jgi:type 1 glutamine amidotransferase
MKSRITVVMALLVAAAICGGAAPPAPKIVVITAEQEYNAKETLPAFFKTHVPAELASNTKFINSDSTTDIPGLDALDDADLLVLFVRRRTLPDEQMAKIRGYLDRGKPLVALRTASHAFETWKEFDHEVLGGNYQGHHAKDLAITVRRAEDAGDGNPLLKDVKTPFVSKASLYKNTPLAKTAKPLLSGKIEGRPEEPVAWTNTYKGGRVFYTSLGHQEDFNLPAFRALLLKGITWALEAPKREVNVKEHGAIGDGQALDTDAIQKAIDACASAGGGTVVVPKGQFLVGTVLLKDNVTLHVDEGAELRGTTDLSKYKNVDPFKDGLGADVGYAMLAAVDAKNVGISGNGTIHGNGKAVAAAKGFKGEGWGFRPMLLRVVRCENVNVRGVTFRDSASWTTNYFRCRNVTIDGVTIDSHVAPHNDGINIDSCEDFTIRDCDVDSGDDALVLKSTSPEPCGNITATGLRLKSRQGAIKLGTESYGGFEHIRVSNCQIRDTNNGGIKVLCVDGGTLRDVVIENVTMDNIRTPIFVRLGARLKSFRPGVGPRKNAGEMVDVTIRNVKAKAAADAQLMPPSGVFVTGIPDHPIRNLTLENIEIDLAGGGTAEHARAVVDQKPDTYPEINRFGPRLPAFGIFARHVDGLSVRGLTLTVQSPDLRPAVVCQDVKRLALDGAKLPGAAGAESVVRLEACGAAEISQVRVDGKAERFVLVEGGDAAGVNVTDATLDPAMTRVATQAR